MSKPLDPWNRLSRMFLEDTYPEAIKVIDDLAARAEKDEEQRRISDLNAADALARAEKAERERDAERVAGMEAEGALAKAEKRAKTAEEEWQREQLRAEKAEERASWESGRWQGERRQLILRAEKAEAESLHLHAHLLARAEKAERERDELADWLAEAYVTTRAQILEDVERELAKETA